ncbi:hypothetical protein ACFFGH_15970 [Lysobacter korlensis]|uniref:Integrase catalytic domain-containing protein n=1 Tax=Lysobacter korlensis TaxID=553636 RepID=A0ABV6RSF9_9GAMM
MNLTSFSRFKDREAARSAVFEYVELFYNRVRIAFGAGISVAGAGGAGIPTGQVCILTTCLWNAGQPNLTPFFFFCLFCGQKNPDQSRGF